MHEPKQPRLTLSECAACEHQQDTSRNGNSQAADNLLNLLLCVEVVRGRHASNVHVCCCHLSATQHVRKPLKLALGKQPNLSAPRKIGSYMQLMSRTQGLTLPIRAQLVQCIISNLIEGCVQST